ncbi:uncharacterized protein LOC130131795 [Lampris incognitus]|uniref:uncharacterized protein LOC130131795 n=1 Tax=Lampris incognitus TaxID=2546036 RepID=UPI0024B4AE5E|nr:uncharacterized protein LOC130131795 [Lampris incognitus]
MWLKVFILIISLCSCQPASVFLGAEQAHKLLVRTKRYNSGWFEEVKRGSLEQECLEEKCSFEEAREVFEHTELTNEFWKTYEDLCVSNPCLNGGICQSKANGYDCFCPAEFIGRVCEREAKVVPTCALDNGGCEHFCEGEVGKVNCSCADGYFLGADGKSCLPQEPITCGTLPVLPGSVKADQVDPRSRIVGGTVCPKGHCPWQVLLVYKDKGFCGGMIYKPTWVITASHCVEDTRVRYLQVVAGEHDILVNEGTEQVIQVAEIIMHESYDSAVANNDIALLRLERPISYNPYAVPVCLPTRALAERDLWGVGMHTVSGWGRRSENGPTSNYLRRLQVPVIRTQTCIEESHVVLTDNMFCAGYLDGSMDSCKGDSGGPLVTRYRKTVFLLGIVSWGKGCARPGNYGIYTRVSKYLEWIHNHTRPLARLQNDTEALIHNLTIFLDEDDAHAVLQRFRRANSGFLEELKPGNLERECIEEVCDYEEAREVFEDNDQTCLEGFEGRYCQTVFEDSLKCLYQNGGCQHFCDGSGPKRKCSCADGYALGDDSRECVARVQYPCGRIPPQPEGNQTMQSQTRLVGGNDCPKGECPWQVLVQYRGNSHCGGVLVHPDWVITAAHCIHGNDTQTLTVVAGEHNLDQEEGTEQRISVSMVIAHEHYAPETGDSDIALLRLSQPVILGRHAVPICLPRRHFLESELTTVRYHNVMGWGRRTTGGNVEKPGTLPHPSSPVLRRLSIPILPNSQCSQRGGFNFTQHMLCAGYLEGNQPSCRGDDGSPLVTVYGSTHFLTGVVGWGRGCPHPGYYGVYANMAYFVDWLESTMKAPPTMPVANKNQVEKAAPSPDVMPEQKLMYKEAIVIVLAQSEFPASPLEESSAMFWPFQAFVCLLLLQHATSAVFLDGQSASEVLSRRRRANSMFEELRKGDMERECLEEICNREEAREIFENEAQTDEFWALYIDGDACESNPCFNNAQCKDTVGGYNCFCLPDYQGYNCEIEIPGLCENENGGCEHFCDIMDGKVLCSCADGYVLDSDDKSCFSNETYKCGHIIGKGTRSNFGHIRPNDTNTNSMDLDNNSTGEVDILNLHLPMFQIPPSNISWLQGGDYQDDMVMEDPVVQNRLSHARIVNGEECPPGECPWQALIMNEEHLGFCGGTVINNYIIVTAAHCMKQSRYIYVVVGEFDTSLSEGHEAVHDVESVLIHRNYRKDTYHNDIALIKLTRPITFTQYVLPACLPKTRFAEKVLMRQTEGLVSGFGRLGEGHKPSTTLQRLTMPFVDRAECKESSKFPISHRMFCAGYSDIEKDACQGDSGGPHVTRYRDTYFLTGVVSWGEGCARRKKYGIYTQVSKYVGWIKDKMRRLIPDVKPTDATPEAGRLKRDTAHIKRLWA